MSDLISREEVIEVVKESFECGWYLMETISHIEELPTIDAVPVVRCKECAYLDQETRFCFGRGFPAVMVPDDGYCNCGERKTNEED